MPTLQSRNFFSDPASLQKEQADIFVCPDCRSTLQFHDERLTCTQCGDVLVLQDGIWRAHYLIDASEPNHYGDIDYAGRAQSPYTTTAREEILYKRHILETLHKAGPWDLAMDLGCGDGRFTRLMLGNGVNRVLAVDLDRDNLQRMKHRLSQHDRPRVLLMQADMTRLALKPGILDAVLALGVLNVLGDGFTSMCAQLGGLLKPGGCLVNSEPAIEGALLYALVRHDIEEFLTVAQTNTKCVDIEGDKTKRVPVFKEKEITGALSAAGLAVFKQEGISVFPSLVYGGLLRLKDISESRKKALTSVVDDLGISDLNAQRVHFFVSRKP